MAIDRAKEFTGTMPVREKHAFDVGRLQEWMQDHVEGFEGPLEVEQFKGGQSNPTFRLSAKSGRYVMRRKPPGELLKSAHAVDREFRVISGLHQTDVPVARPYALCEDESVVGTMFYIMDCVEGRIFWTPDLPEVDKDERGAIYEGMCDAFAKLHMVDYEAVGLGDYGKPGSYFLRQISRWSKQYKASETEHIEEMERLMEWLPENIPDNEETSIVHGDFRLDNMIFHPTEPRVLAILDWELSTIGHPLSDFSYNCMQYNLPSNVFNGLADKDLNALGIPSEEEYVAMYCAKTGRKNIPNWNFYLSFNMFRLSAISQGIMGRVLAGTAANKSAEATGSNARPLAEQAWKQALLAGAS